MSFAQNLMMTAFERDYEFLPFNMCGKSRFTFEFEGFDDLVLTEEHSNYHIGLNIALEALKGIVRVYKNKNIFGMPFIAYMPSGGWGKGKFILKVEMMEKKTFQELRKNVDK